MADRPFKTRRLTALGSQRRTPADLRVLNDPDVLLLSEALASSNRSEVGRLVALVRETHGQRQLEKWWRVIRS